MFGINTGFPPRRGFGQLLLQTPLEFPPKPEPVYVTPWWGGQETNDICV